MRNDPKENEIDRSIALRSGRAEENMTLDSRRNTHGVYGTTTSVLAGRSDLAASAAHAPGQAQVAVIVPAYNEERFIGSVVLKTLRYADIVLVVDDGSTDGTAEVAAAAGAEVITHEQNLGKGAALNTGFCWARSVDADVVVTIDADGQHFPEDLPAIIQPIVTGGADIVVGSRYLQVAWDVPRHRVLGHQVFNAVTNHLSGVKVTDSQSGFRAFSRRALLAISFASQGFAVESEMQFLAHEHNLRVSEVPVTIKYLDKPKRSVISHGLMVLNGILRLMGQHRPLLYFGVPGVLLQLVGLFWVIQAVNTFRATQMLPTASVLIAGVLLILGTLGFFTGLILHSMRGLLLNMLRPRSDA